MAVNIPNFPTGDLQGIIGMAMSNQQPQQQNMFQGVFGQMVGGAIRNMLQEQMFKSMLDTDDGDEEDKLYQAYLNKVGSV